MENQPIEPNNQEPIHKRFMNHKLASVGIAVAVLAVATCIAFWQKSPVEAPSQQPIVTQPLVQEPDGTADWRTYYDVEYGYEFKYPKSWWIDELNHPVVLVKKDNHNGSFVSINPVNVSEEWAFRTEDPPCSDNTDLPEGQISFAGKTAKECRGASQVSEYRYLRIVNPSHPRWQINNELGYHLEDSAEADKILSTFKFITEEGPFIFSNKRPSGPRAYMYEGSLIVSGEFEVYYPETIHGGTLFFNVDEEFSTKLPQKWGEHPSRFGFDNETYAKQALNIDEKVFDDISVCSLSGRATIAIEGYTSELLESEVYDTSKLVKVISSSPQTTDTCTDRQ